MYKYKFRHKVHNRSDLYCEPRATEEPRVWEKAGAPEHPTRALELICYEIMQISCHGEVPRVVLDDF